MAKQVLNNNVLWGEQRGKINDNFTELYNALTGVNAQTTVADLTERNNLPIDKVGIQVFVTDDGDGKWALYRANQVGTSSNFTKLSDPDLLNAVMSNAAIKAAYESNADTYALTNELIMRWDAKQDEVPDATVETAGKVKVRGHLGTGAPIVYSVEGSDARYVIREAGKSLVTDAEKDSWNEAYMALEGSAFNESTLSKSNDINEAPTSTVRYPSNKAVADYVGIREVGSNLGLLKTTDTPPPTGTHKGDVNSAGTYTNFIDSTSTAIEFTAPELVDNFGYIYVVDNVATKSLVAKKAGAAKIETWTATTFASGSQVIHENNIYESNTSTLSTDVPGVSGKWIFKVNPNLVKSYNLVDYNSLKQLGNWNSSGVWGSSTNTYSVKKFDIAQGTYTLSGVKGISSGAAAIVFFNGSTFDSVIVSDNKRDFTFTVPATATSMAFNLGSLTAVDLNDNPQKNIVMLTKGSVIAPYEPYGYIPKKDYCYISPTGDDTTGDGSFVNPYKSVLRANYNGFSNIKLLAGDYLYTDVNPIEITRIEGYKKDTVKIWSNSHSFSEKTLEPTYTNVYKLTGTYTHDNSTYNIWIDGLPDEATLITKRFPFQKGRTHRLMSTRIVRTTTGTLEEKLAVLEASTVPTWTYDGNTMYVSNIGSIDVAVNKIVVPSVGSFGTANLVIGLKNLDIMYSSFYVNRDYGVDMENVTMLYSTASGVSNSSTTKAYSKLVNVEIGGGYNNGAGYGALARGEETDCWIHDFNDEGSSQHNNASIKRKRSYYTHNRSGVTDVGSAETLMEGCVVVDNVLTAVIFTHSVSGGNDNGNALLVNCAIDQNVTANLPNRVTVMNCRIVGTTGSNVTVL